MNVEDHSTPEGEDPGQETLALLTRITGDPAMAHQLHATSVPPSNGEQPTGSPAEQLDLFEDNSPAQPLPPPQPSRDAPTVHDLPPNVGQRHLTLSDVNNLP